MTDDLAEMVQRDLDALRRDYEAQLGQRIAEIVGAWDATAKSPDRISALPKVVQLAHSLAGTAGVLGLVDVGRAAATLEEALEQSCNAGGHVATDLDESTRRVDLALEQLLRAGAEVVHHA